jgi:hypothetical protein
LEQAQTAGGASFPPVVYVPCTASDSPDEVSLDLRELSDGRIALLTYSALDRLVDCCGSEQPWVLLPSAKLDEVGRSAHFDVIVLDVEIPRSTAGAWPDGGRVQRRRRGGRRHRATVARRGQLVGQPRGLDTAGRRRGAVHSSDHVDDRQAADVAGELATGLLDVGDALKTGAAVYHATDAANAGRFELDGDRPGRAR